MIRVLSKDDLKSITGKSRNDCVIAELRHLGIDYKIRGDGSPLVFEHDLIKEPPQRAKVVKLNLHNL